MNKRISALFLTLLLCVSFWTSFKPKIVYATTNTTFMSVSDTYTAFDSLVNNTSFVAKQPIGLSDKGTMIYGYWIRLNTTSAERGDIIRNGKVSLTSLVWLAEAYGSNVNSTYTNTTSRWNPCTDLDHDGKVGLSDLVLLGEGYGQNWTSYDTKGSKLILMDGCIHGGEYESATLLYNLAVFLSGNSSRALSILSCTQFLIIPIVNVDKFAQTRDDANGVNINRNFPYDWNLAFNDNDSSSEYYDGDINGTSQYRGPSVASENETQQINNIIARAEVGVYDDFHVDGAYNGTNPQGKYMTSTCDGESSANLALEAQVWSNYTSVSSTYNASYTYAHYYADQNVNIYGTSGSNGENFTVPSATVEIWYYDGSDPHSVHPTSDQLNGTMLQEIVCLAEGNKNFLTDQSAQIYQQIKVQPLDSSGTNMYIDPSSINCSQYDDITLNVTISNITNFSAFDITVQWITTKLNCTSVTESDPSGWNESCSAGSGINDTTGNCELAYAGQSGNGFTGNTTILTFTFHVLGFNTNTTIYLYNVEVCDPLANDISVSTTNGSVHIDNQN